PALSLEATVPSLTRSLSKYTLSDGNDIFIRRSVANSSASFSLSKTLVSTGGQVFLSSTLQRVDQLDGERATSYLASPVTIGFRQPLSVFNLGRGGERIEPLRLAESQQQLLEELEQISINATNGFFDLLQSQTRASDARAAQASSDSLFRVMKVRRGSDPAAE